MKKENELPSIQAKKSNSQTYIPECPWFIEAGCQHFVLKKRPTKEARCHYWDSEEKTCKILPTPAA